MEAELNPGFDVSSAIEALHRTAMDLGAKPSPGCGPQNAYDVAFQHVALHGLQEELDDGLRSHPAKRCLVTPCRLGGVCFALHELLQWKREVADPRVRAVMALADAAREYHEATEGPRARFAKAARDLLRSSDVHHELENKHHAPGQFHNHELTCVTPAEATDYSEKLEGHLAKLVGGLPRMIESPELAQPPARKRTTFLLSAVYQHLYWGGWSYREISQLVPDGLGGNCEDRVRHRIKARDARSLLPADELERVLPSKTM